MSKLNIVFSASSIDLLQLCSARYNYARNMNRTLPIIQKATAIDEGSLIHICCESYYKGLAMQQHYDDRVNGAIIAMRAAASDVNTSNASEEQVAYLETTMVQYFDYWRGEDELLEILSVEQPFAYILYEDESIRIIMEGKIDLLVNSPRVSAIGEYSNLPFDHKSTRRDFPVFRLSNQFQNYAAAVNSNYLMVNKIGLQKSLEAHEKFKRIPVSYDPVLIQEWKDNIVSIIYNQYLDSVARNSWPMNYTSCYKFNRLCEFYDVCERSGKESKEEILKSNFIEGSKYNVMEGKREE